MAATAATRDGHRAVPKLVQHGEFDKGEYKRGMSNEECNTLRWSRVELQLAKIHEVWDGEEPMYGIITVETGVSDFKRIGLEMRAQHLDGRFRMAVVSKHQEMCNKLRGKTETQAGDLDDIIEINGKEELTTEEIQKKSLILQAEVTWVHVNIGDEMRHTVSLPVPGAGMSRSPHRSRSPRPASPRRVLSTFSQAGNSEWDKQVRTLNTVLRQMKGSGATLQEVQTKVEELWRALPEQGRADPPALPPQPADNPGPIPGFGKSFHHDTDEDLDRRLNLVRKSDKLAFCCFHFIFED